MTIREIITIPDPRLKIKAKKITSFDKDLHLLIDDMIETMREAPGVGLAAPQLGISQKIFVAEFGDETDEEVEPKVYIFVNPEITERSDDLMMGIEGCLSVPDYVGDVERHLAVTVKAQNKHGKTFKVKAEGWLARIFQHEIDHLHGVLFPDVAEKLYDITEMADEDLEDIV